MLILKAGLLFWTKMPICCFPCLKTNNLGDFPAKSSAKHYPKIAESLSVTCTFVGGMEEQPPIWAKILVRSFSIIAENVGSDFQNDSNRDIVDSSDAALDRNRGDSSE